MSHQHCFYAGLASGRQHHEEQQSHMQQPQYNLDLKCLIWKMRVIPYHCLPLSAIQLCNNFFENQQKSVKYSKDICTRSKIVAEKLNPGYDQQRYLLHISCSKNSIFCPNSVQILFQSIILDDQTCFILRFKRRRKVSNLRISI